MYIRTFLHIYKYTTMFAISHATEPQATRPTGNRAKGTHSYRQPVCIHRRYHRQPVHGQPVHGQLSHKQQFPRATSPTRPLDHKVRCFPRNLKGPRCKHCPAQSSSVVENIAGTNVSEPLVSKIRLTTCFVFQ